MRLNPLFWVSPKFNRHIAVLVLCVAGTIAFIIYENRQEGIAPWSVAAIALLAGVSAATAILIYQERRSRILLRDLRLALERITPGYSNFAVRNPAATGMEGLENEVRALKEQWTEFCTHCQGVHDSEMMHAEHLATLGELATGLAHEIRNPLAGIAGAVETIASRFPNDHPDREIMGDVRQEVRRIERTLNELLAYARPKPPQLAHLDIKETVAHTLQLARQQSGEKRINFAIEISPDLPEFMADSEQLQQVLLNLVLNSIQAIGDEGRVSIEVGSRESAVPGHPSHVEIAVADTGHGIPPEQMEGIFRPFFTTKRGGTGLGLSLCRRIIAAHGGTLVAESQLRKGSRFVIRLPLRGAAEELTQIGVR